MNTRELNRITNERALYLSQLNAILPTISYLLNRLAMAKVPCTDQDKKLIESTSDIIRARTFEEVETIVNKHNDALIDEMVDKFFGGNEAVERLFKDMMDGKKPANEDEPKDAGDGYGEPGYDDFRDQNGNDTWPNN